MSLVTFTQEETLGRITLGNPPENSLGREFAFDLLQAVHNASGSDIRALLIEADGPNFGTGGLVSEWPGKNVHWFRTFIAEVNQAFAAIEALRIPTVVATRGLVTSGHYELALRADIIIASDTASFTWVESRSALTPLAGGIQRLAERIGRGRAASHVMLAETIDAREAMRIGLVHSVVPDQEFDEAAEMLAKYLSNGATRGLAASKALLKAWSAGGVVGADALLLDLSMDLYDTVDAQNAINHIAQAAESGGRYVPPPFSGR